MKDARPSGRSAGRPRRRREDRVWRESTRDGLSLLAATYERQRFARHAQDTFVIGTNSSGAASCFGRSGLVFGPGSLVVIPPGESHGGHRVGREPWGYLAAYPTRGYLKRLLRDVTGSEAAEPGFSRLFYPDADLARRFVAAHRATTLAGDEPLLGESAMIEALATLLERYSTPRRRLRAGREAHRISRAVDYMEAHLEAPLTLTEIAAASGLSRFHFLRVFKRAAGSTPFAYLMRRRVERARELIRDGTPIAEAAYTSGFADQAHLCRRFRQIVGVTPGEYARGTASSRPPGHRRVRPDSTG